MPMRVTRDWLGRAALGVMSGALALSVLTTGVGSTPGMSARPALADDIDCYNDLDLYDMPECVERRAIDMANGEQPNEAQAAPIDENGQPTAGTQEASGSPSQDGGNQPTQQAGNPPAQQTSSEGDDEPAEPVRAAITDPRQVVLTAADAGKEATEYKNEDGTDKWGKFAHTRFERDRSSGASTLGPNVIDNKVWVAKDAEAAKQLFKEQAAVKNFPERKEGVNGPVEKIKPTSYGEEFAFIGGFWQDEKIWHHWRFVIRQNNIVSVVYLYGREEFFQDPKDQNWTGQGDWFTSTVFHRM